MHVSKTFNWKEIWKAALNHEKGAEIISKVPRLVYKCQLKYALEHFTPWQIYGCPRAYVNRLCDWLKITTKDKLYIEIIFLKDES
jgi:hypothetical protein